MDKDLNQLRVKKINNCPDNQEGSYVFYWVINGLRIDYNFALKFAIEKANKFQKPLLVFFGLRDGYYWSNLRHYQFLKEGLIEFYQNLKKLNIAFIVKKIDSDDYILNYAKKAVAIVSDEVYLSGTKKRQEFIADKINTSFYLFESNSYYPVNTLLNKKANFAWQIRDKVFNCLNLINKDFFIEKLKINSLNFFENFEKEDIEKEFNKLNLDKRIYFKKFIGGESKALKILDDFIDKKLPFYSQFRSNPEKDYTSNLSCYLHFGNISPVKVVKKILEKHSLKDKNVYSFFNELLVWRELAFNFVYFDKNYFNFNSIPFWAKKTLDDHKNDKRDYLYSFDDLEKGKTHDNYWNTCQKEMVYLGKMANYMRMYWAKKVIEWSADFKKAYDWLVKTNNKYELDGRDPNSYLGVSWCFGNFDRPWFERKIIGKIRYMSANGLENKFDIKKYVEKVNKELSLNTKDLFHK